ncbi:MAG TPA: GDSL-type esterase/lipase family protein [Bryobacteraceae bacterium]|nr:GDSL-type esterase/lipase family protein [Bryobacteraceae bacterium]
MITRFTRWVATLTLLTIPAFAANEKNSTYLALGDSISYGFNPVLLLSQPSGLSEASFVGYPEIAAQALNLMQPRKLASTSLVNASCPGETSASFLDTSARDNGCNQPHIGPSGPEGPPFKYSGLMHTSYNGSQINFALSQLRSNKSIDLVTLSIGGNDLLLVMQDCQAQTTLPFDVCVGGRLPSVLGDFARNLSTILTSIRNNYSGKVVVVNIYSPSPNPLFVYAVQQLNGVIQQVSAPPVKIADAFQAFQNFGPDPCPVLVIPISPTSCDVHPSLIGQGVLAATVLSQIKP